jgi:hypothetical protein
MVGPSRQLYQKSFTGNKGKRGREEQENQRKNEEERQ